MSNNTLLGIELPTESKQEVLEKIIKYTGDTKGFFHIISLNPEILVTAQHDPEFKRVVAEGNIKIVDGVGIVLAGQILGKHIGSRYTGVDLMLEMLKLASARSLRVALIGGGPKVAEQVVDCQKQAHPRLEIFGIEGISNINNPKKFEEKKIFSIVADRKPHFVFTAFGSPQTELWLGKHKKHFEGSICMSVGGSFDFLSGNTSRAPRIMQQLGFEWLYRLIRQPWRWRRQLKLIEFGWLVVKERFRS